MPVGAAARAPLQYPPVQYRCSSLAVPLQYPLLYSQVLAGVTGPTEIFLHRALHYPAGAAVSVTPVSAATWANSSDVNIIHVLHTDGARPGDSITVTVKRAAS